MQKSGNNCKTELASIEIRPNLSYFLTASDLQHSFAWPPRSIRPLPRKQAIDPLVGKTS
jgi:hypothetical protein